jgi:hypothetical protein
LRRTSRYCRIIGVSLGASITIYERGHARGEAVLRARTGSRFLFATKTTKDAKAWVDSKHISFHSIIQFGDVEVEHQAGPDSRKLHVG